MKDLSLSLKFCLPQKEEVQPNFILARIKLLSEIKREICINDCGGGCEVGSGICLISLEVLHALASTYDCF